MVTCPNCLTGHAAMHPIMGLLPCVSCSKKHASYQTPKQQCEVTTDSIRLERRAYANDIIQPFRKGKVSKEYIDIYGSAQVKKMGVTESEIKHAGYVWNDLTYYKKGV